MISFNRERPGNFVKSPRVYTEKQVTLDLF